MGDCGASGVESDGSWSWLSGRQTVEHADISETEFLPSVKNDDEVLISMFLADQDFGKVMTICRVHRKMRRLLETGNGMLKVKENMGENEHTASGCACPHR